MNNSASETTGIMFTNFPTVDELSRTNYINTYSMDLDAISDWRAVAYNPNSLTYYDDDSEAMDETNWDVLLSELPEPEPITSDFRGGSDFGWHTVGIEDALETGVAILSGVSGSVLIVAPDQDEILDRMRELESSLSNYPLLDESAYSEREWQAWEEYAPQALRDEINYEMPKDGRFSEELVERLEDCDQSELLGILAQYLDFNYGFSGEYSPSFADILASMLFDHEVSDWQEGDARKVREMLGVCDISREPHIPGERCGIPTCPSNLAPGQGKFSLDYALG